jgi:RNA polymerase sigma-70 factor (ECF subfamily)
VARLKSFELLRKNTFRTMSLAEDVLETLELEWKWADALATAEEIDYLRRCIQLLTPHARRILHLRYTEGLSGIRVAEQINVKVRSVYVALARIHKTLGDCIRQQRASAEVAHGG